jgi:hypothetical protein
MERGDGPHASSSTSNYCRLLVAKFEVLQVTPGVSTCPLLDNLQEAT